MVGVEQPVVGFPMLRPAKTPQGPHVGARNQHAEVMWGDRNWRPVVILAWHKLTEPPRQGGHSVTWVVQLQFTDEATGWYFFDAGNLRPVRP